MAAADRPPSPRVTYCGNCHAAGSVAQWLQQTRRYAGGVAEARRALGHRFGLGTWWDAGTVRELTTGPDAAARMDAVRALLAEIEAPVWTVNGFPTGPFHGAPVKERVYRPDWWEDARLEYTLGLLDIVGELTPAGESVSISTLPLGFKERAGADPARAAELLGRVVERAMELADRSGAHVRLALEPEPDCLIERVDDLVRWLETHRPAAVSEAAWREHIGVCVDLCHGAVVGEDPVAAVDQVRGAGFQVPKVQVSACLELRDPAAGLARLLAFDEPVYLHQTRGVGAGERPRALDLREVAAQSDRFRAEELLRCHFHVPIYWDGDAVLGSTRHQVEAAVPALAALPDPPLLEVETYTWDVLRSASEAASAGADASRELTSDLLRELAFVDGLLLDHTAADPA